MTDQYNQAYANAQIAMAQLKAAVRTVLANGPEDGMRNVEIGKTLGIYSGHIEHEGHISRTILAIMESEGVVEQQDQSKRWTLKRHSS